MGVTTIFEPQLSRLDWDISFFFIRTPTPPPLPPMEGYVVFMVGTIEDGIRVVQNVVGVLIKDRGWEGGRGTGRGRGRRRRGGGEREKKLGFPILFSAPHFLFRSAAAR